MEYKELATAIRLAALRMTYKSNASHIGSCLSCADILAVLYGGVLNVSPDKLRDVSRDRFILSKGHAAAVLYAVLAKTKFFSEDLLEDYYQNGSQFSGHANHHISGVELSTGSLGHGLSVGCGMALVGKREKLPYKVIVLMSDGELDEGSNWEAILFASHHKLDNIISIIDLNNLQGFGRTRDIIDLSPLAEKWKAFGWSPIEIDGHNYKQIQNAFLQCQNKNGKPFVIIAHTVKGKGVSFMEDQLSWHYKSPNKDQLEKAISELEAQL
jgi:transketolase